MNKNFVFTITTGRSGQATLFNILKKASVDCVSAFEAPNFKPYFPWFLGDLEKTLRRRFFETNELLGRGKVLRAYEEKNYIYIENIAKKRLEIINRQMNKTNAESYFDVSKYYVRGLYKGFNNLLEKVSIVFLVRDPLENMKSFLNRNKNFFLDNSLPTKDSNILKMDNNSLSKGELYLWSWAETFLRFNKISESANVKKKIIFKSEDLYSPKKVKSLLDFLEIKHSSINTIEKINTNEQEGFAKTEIDENDLNILHEFIEKLSRDNIDLISLLKSSLQRHKKN